MRTDRFRTKAGSLWKQRLDSRTKSFKFSLLLLFLVLMLAQCCPVSGIKKLFVAFPWVETSTGPGGFMICVFII